jgi:hypothetical protein
MNAADPHTMDPTGAPSPFEKQKLTTSNGAAICFGGDAQRDCRVEDARAVQVQRDAARLRHRRDLLDVVQRQRCAPTTVVRAFEANHARFRGVDGIADRALQPLQRDGSVRQVRQHMQKHIPEDAQPAHFGGIQV